MTQSLSVSDNISNRMREHSLDEQIQYITYGRGNSYNTVPMVKAIVAIQYLITIQYLCMVNSTVTIQYL